MILEKRQTNFGRRIAIVLVAILIAAEFWNILRPVSPVYANKMISDYKTAMLPDINWPSGVEAAVGAKGFGLLAKTQQQTPLPTASIAKVVAVLAVLQKKPLNSGQQGPTLTMSNDDVTLYDQYVEQQGSVVEVVAGEKLTEYQILQAILLPSANNLADSLAIWAFGSLENYQTYATKMVQDLGAKHTTIGKDASGLDPGSKSTPEDLILLGEAALNNPVIAQIVSQPHATLPVVGEVSNVNWLLGTHGVTGIKTGSSDQAGGCFLGAAKHDFGGGKSVTVISAIMGDPNLTAVLSDSAELLDSVAANFSESTVVKANQAVGTYKTPWAGQITAVAKSDIKLVTWAGSQLSPKADFDKIDGQLNQGAKVGTLTVQSGPDKASSDIILQATVPSPNFWWRAARFN